MFVGTCSDAGKSLVNTAFCRIFLQDGYHPAPFKAQNMSLNSYSTPEGGEIGRAQAAQAEACGILPHTDMNPVLLKPSDEKSSQLVLHGQPVGTMSARDYFCPDHKLQLLDEAAGAFRRLEMKYSPIVLEGAGSISELNLRDRDITNMRMAKLVDAAVYLVADIDRGGVFASVYGSVMLLPEDERKLIKGIIINKFRGDVSLFDEGRMLIQELTGIPVVGVLPYFRDIHIEEEDSVALSMKNVHAVTGKINVAVVLLGRLSNFTDFAVLEQDQRFHLYYTNQVGEMEKADIIILPGTKNTLGDLQEIHSNGIAEAVVRAYKKGKKVIGICGGFQMLGLRVEDPKGVEGNVTALPGLGLLPLTTVMEKEKIVCQSEFYFKEKQSKCRGYQIHMGRTVCCCREDEKVSPKEGFLNRLLDGSVEGYQLDGRCWGTYMHGILDNPVVLNDLARGQAPDIAEEFDYMAYKEQQYDRLAGYVRAAVDLEYIYSTINPLTY